MNILSQVNRVILGAAETPEEAIRYYIQLMIEGAKDVARHYPRHIDAKVFPITKNVVKTRLDAAELLLNVFDQYLTKMTLLWTDIAKRRNMPKILDMFKLLEQETVDFKKELTTSFEDMENAAIAHSSNISFVLANYNLTNLETKKLIKMQMRLKKVSEMTYVKFIAALKSGKLNQL